MTSGDILGSAIHTFSENVTDSFGQSLIADVFGPMQESLAVLNMLDTEINEVAIRFSEREQEAPMLSGEDHDECDFV